MNPQHFLRIVVILLTSLTSAILQAQNTPPYWSMSGNSNASTSSRLGTTTATSLRLFTKNKERLRIDTIGRVLIGPTTATARLSVNAAPGTSPFVAQVGGVTKLYASNGGGLSIGSGSTPPANGLFVAGNVGIGTATPTPGYRLHVAGKGRITNGLLITNGDIQLTNPSGVAMTVKGNTGGINVESVDESLGYPVGSGIGVESFGGIGVKGVGSYGIQGYGDDDEGGGTGVYGWGYTTGVQGDAPDGTAVVATGMRGITAVGSAEEAITASGYFFGLVASAQIYGVQGHATAPDGYGGEFTSAGTGLHASAGSEPGGYAAQFDGKVYASGVFQSSDRNLKQNIQEFEGAMSIIEKLKPRNYEFKTDSKLAALHLPQGTHFGLIAQDVAEVLPNLVADVRHNLNPAKAPDTATWVTQQGKYPKIVVQPQKREHPAPDMLTTKAVNYIELIPIVIKGMQEQDQRIQQQEAENKGLQQEVAELKQMVLELKSVTNSVTAARAYLEQNTPNPVKGTTIIRYHIPEPVTSALLSITNAKGQVVKAMQLNSGSGQVSLNTTVLASGTYNYTLYVDGKQTDSKRLIIAK